MVKREGDIEQLDRGLHFVNKKIKYVWDPNLQVSHHFFFSHVRFSNDNKNDAVALGICAFAGFFKKHILPIFRKCSKWSFKWAFFCSKSLLFPFQTYTKLTAIDEHMKQSEFHKAREGLTDLSVNDRLETYGTNFIKISVPPILYLLVHEVSFY